MGMLSIPHRVLSEHMVPQVPPALRGTKVILEPPDQKEIKETQELQEQPEKV